MVEEWFMPYNIYSPIFHDFKFYMEFSHYVESMSVLYT